MAGVQHGANAEEKRQHPLCGIVAPVPETQADEPKRARQERQHAEE